MIKCNECGHECKAANALSYHLRSHGLNYVDYVVKHQHGNVWPACTCGKQLELKKGGFGKFCSISCASSGENNGMSGLKGKSSPNFGLKRTPDQLKNYSTGAKKRWALYGDMLRKMMKTDEYRNANSLAQQRAYKNDPLLSQRRSNDNRMFWSSGSDLAKQRRKEASDRAIMLLEQGKIGPHAPFKACWFENPFTGKEERMHSSWETAFLSKCITEGYPVTKQHDLRIPYVANDGTDHVYVPDFIALEEKVVFEIKGLMRENDDLKLRALNAWAERNGYEVVLVSEVSTDI